VPHRARRGAARRGAAAQRRRGGGAMEGVGPRLERVCPNCGGRDMVEVHSEGDVVCKVRPGGRAGPAGRRRSRCAPPRARRRAPPCRGPRAPAAVLRGASTAPLPSTQGCGLVVEAHIIDERSEWRTFGDKDKEGDDPSRVGGASNPLLDDGGLGTMIGRVQGDGGASFALNKMHMRQVPGRGGVC
jgi:hypothetical protein